MARLDGVRGDTLNPPNRPKREPKKPPAQVVKEEIVLEAPCVACGAVLRLRGRNNRGSGELHLSESYRDPFTLWRPDPDEELCRHCLQMLQTASGNGLTGNCKETLEKIAKCKEDGMVVMLKSNHFGTPHGGTVELDFGDVFKVKRAGSEPRGTSGYEHSKEIFTIDINVGPVQVTLYPHEVAPMSMITVLQLQADKDYEMAYVSKDDPEGYFTLTPKAKELCQLWFGEK